MFGTPSLDQDRLNRDWFLLGAETLLSDAGANGRLMEVEKDIPNVLSRLSPKAFLALLPLLPFFPTGLAVRNIRELVFGALHKISELYKAFKALIKI